MANSGANELFWHNHTTLVEGAHNAFIVFRASLALELAKQFTILGIPVLVPAAAESNVASEDDPGHQQKMAMKRWVVDVWGWEELTFADNKDNWASITCSVKPLATLKALDRVLDDIRAHSPSLKLADVNVETTDAIGIVVAVEVPELGSAMLLTPEASLFEAEMS